VKDEELKQQLASACWNQIFIAEAPLIVVACGHKIDYSRGRYMGDLSMLVDLSIAFTHLVLAARAEGLGTCWIGGFDNEKVKQLLNIPGEVNVVALTPLGYPKGEKFTEPHSRKTVEEIISIDSY
jgi:nitroreductase